MGSLSTADASLDRDVGDRKLTHEELYQRHAALYPVVFRSQIDYQRAEKPKQVKWALVLIFVLSLAAFLYTPSPPHDSSANAKLGAFAALICICTYCFLQTKDSLLVRPHPGIWRIIHGFGLLYLLLLAVLLVQNVDSGRYFLSLLFPTVQKRQTESFQPHVSCALTLENFSRQLLQFWTVCHVSVFVLKMCIFRDWTFCLVNSILFEVCELSFQWLIPELKECWWNSLILDSLCNLLGMFLGAYVLRFLSSFRYDWSGSKPLGFKRLLVRTLPFYWSDWHWGFFLTAERAFWAAVMIIMSLALELNSFFLLYSLDISPPPTSAFLVCRIFCVIALSIPAAAEHHDYVNTHRRLGQNAWLLVVITILELLVFVKYGWHRFARLIPDVPVLIPHTVALLAIMAWCYARYAVVGTAEQQLRAKKETAHDSLCGLSSASSADDNLSANGVKLRRNDEGVDRGVMLRSLSSCSETTGSEKVTLEDEDSAGCDVRRRRHQKGAKANSAAEEETKSEVLHGEHCLTESERLSLLKHQAARRQMWGPLYRLGEMIVKVPVMVCFLPLAFLARYYQTS